jgi:hypothetical protein
VFEGFVPTAKLVNGKAYSIISDHLGTPILAVDSEGNEVWNRQLDIYGRVKREIKASSLGEDVRPFIPFLYQGQYYDFETKLAYNRFRYYSPETGAYISQDPIGLAGGNPTLYGYVGDSNLEIDIFGLNRRGNCQTQKQNEDVRDQFLQENMNAAHIGGSFIKGTKIEIPETYLPPKVLLASGKQGGSFADLTFELPNKTTVYVQTVDKGSYFGMDKREWDNANRIIRQEPNSIVITVRKGHQLQAGDLDVKANYMQGGNIYTY